MDERPPPAARNGIARTRYVAPPEGDGSEQIEIHTDDGHALRADVREPPRGSRLVGVAVLAHAMFARRSEFARPRGAGLARFLADRGWRTIAFDFRGHGESGKAASRGGAWSYDDLVMRDLPAVVACARARSRKVPVVVMGHSLGGHVALASQGIGLLGADAIVGFGASLWLRAWEPSPARWGVKRGIIAASRAILERRGFFPARALRQGSDDESYGYMNALFRMTERGAWRSDDFRHDYAAALARVRIPVVGVASDGDRIQAVPACVARMVEQCGGPREMIRVRDADARGRAPGHMELVTSDAARGAWTRVEEHARTALRPRR